MSDEIRVYFFLKNSKGKILKEVFQMFPKYSNIKTILEYSWESLPYGYKPYFM